MITTITSTKDNQKTGSTKEVILRNGFRPKVKKVKGVKMKNDMNFSETVKHYKEKFEKNPKKYSSTNLGAFNWSMSPRELFQYFMTFDEIKLAVSKIKSWFISNSEMNRPPSTQGGLFESRMAYCYGIVAGVSDANFFPVSMIDNSDGVDRMVTHLVLKDRGNLTAILKRGEEKILTAKKWWDLLDKIEGHEYNEYKLKNERFAKILKDSKNRLEKFNSKERTKIKLSLKEVIGTDVWNEWYDAPNAINLRVRFETQGAHANEMQAYNNTETAWVQYNYLSGSISLAGFYSMDEVALSAQSQIHAECVDKKLFLGLNSEILSKVRHKNCEGFEFWFIANNVACLNLR